MSGGTARTRLIAQEVADFILSDPQIHASGNVSVVVEDKGDFAFQINQALGSLGVCVTIAVTGFRRVDKSPILQGVLDVQISAYEHPSLNRNDESVRTAQGVMERVAEILHYHQFVHADNIFLFKDFSRDDVDEANIVRGNFEVMTRIGCAEATAEDKTEGG